MNAVVLFRAGTGRYALDVTHAGTVLTLDEDPQPLPAPRDGISGVLRVAGETLPVLDVLDTGGRQLIVVESARGRFLLRVGEVTGVLRLGDGGAPAPPPAGQHAGVVTGVVDEADGALLVDPTALAAHVH